MRILLPVMTIGFSTTPIYHTEVNPQFYSVTYLLYPNNKSFFQKKISRKTLINTMHSGYVMDYSTAKEWGYSDGYKKYRVSLLHISSKKRPRKGSFLMNYYIDF